MESIVCAICRSEVTDSGNRYPALKPTLFNSTYIWQLYSPTIELPENMGKKMKHPIAITTLIAAFSLSAALIGNEVTTEDHNYSETNKATTHSAEQKSETENGHDHDSKQEEHNTSEEKDHDVHGEDEHKEGDKHRHEHDHGHEEESNGKLTADQIKQAGIELITISEQSVNQQITVPAEVKLNQYRTTQITPHLTTQVKARYVKLGDHVSKGQKLLSLQAITTPELAANMISIADLEAGLAEARGEYSVADSEWKRVKSIGSDLISKKRISDAKIARDQAASKVKAYQRSQKKMKSMMSAGTKRGTFNLTAPQSGTIISDKFVIGQVVEPGDVLFEISDTNKLWVEARVKPNIISKIKKGSSVAVGKEGKPTTAGKVINIGRMLDEETRTLAVRIELDSSNSDLYPGQFVQAHISTTTNHSGIIVPSEAVMRSPDGDWMVLIEEAPNQFEPKEIEVKQNLGDKVVISGLAIGSKIVSKGAFFVQSEIAKSGFSVHNH